MKTYNPWQVSKIDQLQTLLKDKGLHGAFFFHPIDLFYFTGKTLGTLLYIPCVGDIKLFTRKGLNRLKATHPQMSVNAYRSFKDLKEHISYSAQDRFGVVFDQTPFLLVNSLVKAFEVPLEQIQDISPLLNQVKMIKTPDEIQAIKDSATHLSHAFLSLNKENTLGKSEIEISQFIDTQLQLKGSKGEQFRSPYHLHHGSGVYTKESILALNTEDITYGGFGFAPNLSTGSSFQTIQADIPFVIDAVAATQGLYCDMTRTFINGKASDRFKGRYEDLLSILNYIESLLKPDALCSEIYQKTLEFVKKLGYQDHFMGINGHFVPFIGHSVGAFVDEFPAVAPKIDVPLKANMTLAIEPKFYFEDFDSMGVENTYVITENGASSLSFLDNQYLTLE